MAPSTTASPEAWVRPPNNANVPALVAGTGEIRDDGFEFLHHRCKRFHDVEELLDHLEKSSQAIEEAAAVPRIFRDDGSGSKSVVYESLHVVFRSKSVVSESRDDRF
jgi:hypothetical protein